jgi:predicted CoA-binding protein
MNKRTLVIGASPNPTRFAFKATTMLTDYGHEAVPYSRKKGDINGVSIVNEWPEGTCFDTVALYVNPKLQVQYYQAIIDLNPLRVIFNPGTENPEFQSKLEEYKIEALEACTLVLLQTNQY